MEVASNVLLEAATLVLRADGNATSTSPSPSATSSSSATAEGRPPIYKVIGIVLAISSGVFIGISFVLKKVGLLRANVKYNEEAGEGYGYLKNFYWWIGMTLMIIGEVCNFAAYMFVDAIIVTPMGALSVVITAILSAIFLKERLSFVGKIGCFQCILGSVVIVLSAPEQSAVADIQEMQHFVIAPGFLSYAGVIIVGCVIVALWAGPRYGKKSMLVYLTVCSLIGGLSVVATQGLGSAIIAQINGESQFKHWFLYVLFVFVIATLLTEIVYLNKALNLFNAALVTPTYYVYFTSSTIVASAILFRGFHGTPAQIANVVIGFFVICSGVVLLQLAKSAKDVPDTTVFKGDLDQVRTVAEQEEPEYEPRADTIRGGGAIVRAISKARSQRQMEEAHKLREEMMEPIGENEEVQWDGVRRRKTISTTASGSVKRTKTIHPPLGMSRFPEEDDISEPDSEVHPGFFGRIGRSRREHKAFRSQKRAGTSPVPMTTVVPNKDGADEHAAHEHVYGLPPGLQRGNDDDTSYKSYGSTHIQWAGQLPQNRPDDRDAIPSNNNLAPPRPPPHSSGQAGQQRRQFSFQNVFRSSSNNNDSESAASIDRPISRGALSFVSRHSSTSYSKRRTSQTEEERLGLVQGDSTRALLTREESLPVYAEEDDGSRQRRGSDTEEGWHMTSAASARSSPEDVTLTGDLGDNSSRKNRPSRGRGDPYTELDDDDDDTFYDQPLHSPKGFDDAASGGAAGGRAFV
ncbi:DUF803-domain-containing protein [Polychaeton citri CBS 116435]|uniref:DUF803-domain-containing protein n=1 Tax=Polychaeton citri CBS 116435 TaxID=1314669 RepID=A0A9P4URK7_9PEZI|nr:DUF803-domain-containing protein [Polychaeton citri CBS 116435]